MPCMQACPMANTDNSSVRQARFEHFIELRFRSFIKRRCGFIHEDKLRFDQKNASEGYTLLLAYGEDIRPLFGFTQIACKFIQLAREKHVTQFFIFYFWRIRVAENLLQ